MSKIDRSESLPQVSPRTFINMCVSKYMDENLRKIPAIVMGPPGCGKTESIVQAYKKLKEIIPDLELTTVIASLRSETDFLGVPFPSEDRTHVNWLLPEDTWKLTQPGYKCIALYDELPDAPRAVQKPVQNFFQSRQINGRMVSDGVMFLAAGNRTFDGSQTNRLNTALNNRMQHFEMIVDHNQWLHDYAIPNDIDMAIKTFVARFPGEWLSFNPAKTINVTPRSWANVSKFLKADISEDEKDLACLSLLGDGIGNAFMAHYKIYRRFPDLDAIEQGRKAEVPKEADVQAAVACTLAFRANSKTFGNVIKYFENGFGEEWLILGIKLALDINKQKDPRMGEVPEYQKALQNHKGLIL